MLKILRVFYTFVLKKKVAFTFFILLLLASAITDNIQPYFYKLFVDAIPKFNYSNLLSIFIAYIVVRMLSTIFFVLSYFVGDVVLINSAADARTTIFKHVQDLDFAFHTNKSTGSLISAFKRGDGAFFGFFQSLHNKIFEIAVGFIVMIYFFTKIDPLISILVFVSSAISLVVSRFIVGYNVKARMQFNKEEDNLSGIIVDNMINYETVKLFAKEDWELDRLKNAFTAWKKYLWKYANSFRLIDITLGSLINLSVFAVLLISLNLSNGYKMSVGDFVLVVGFINLFYPQLRELIWSIRDIAKNYSDIKTYFDLLDNKIQVKDPVNEKKITTVKGEVEFKNVSFTYKGRVKALKDIDLVVRQGQSIALVGRSGVGKTTLVRLLMRFFDVTQGQITIDGINIKDFSKTRLRSFMGVVPQEPILFNNTIGYNIAYGKENTTKKEITAAAKMANIDEFIESLPEKYDTEVGERGIKLSGGQKQRLAIARMILSDPDIIIFDEATSHLDSESEKLIQEAFWKAAKNKTTIIIAHRLSTVMKADKIVVMEKGKIIETGSHNELIHEKKSLYKHFWDLQSSFS